MADQKTLKIGANGAVSGVLEGIGGLGHSLVTLGALQARLAAEDCRTSVRRSLPGVVALALVVPILIASTSVALGGAALWLAESQSLSLKASLLIVAGAGLTLCMILAGLGLWKLRGSGSSFNRSREEFDRNVAWLGTVLSQSGR